MKLTKQQKNILQLMRDYKDKGPITYRFIDNCIPVMKKSFGKLLTEGYITRSEWDINKPAMYSLTETGKTVDL